MLDKAYQARILVVDDEPDVRLLLAREISGKGHEVVKVADSAQAIEEMGRGDFDIILTDIRMPGMDGMGLTEWIKCKRPDTDVIVMTGYASIESAATAVRLGAFDYLLKPFGEMDLVTSSLDRAIEKRRLNEELRWNVEELRASQASFRSVVEKNSDGVVIVDSNGIVRFANPAVEKLLNRKAKELVGGSFGYSVVAGETTEHEIIGRGGERVITEMHVVETEWEDEIAYLASLRDITERKRVEEATRKLSRVVDQTADCVLITDKNGVIEYVNPAFEEFTGYTKEEAIGKTPRIIKSNQCNKEFYEGSWKPITSGKIFRSVVVNRKKGGELYYEEKTITPLRDSQGTITHFVSTGKDITQRQQIEKERSELLAVTQHQVQRLAILGKITQAINSTLDIRTILGLLLEKVDHLLPYSAASVRLLNINTGELEPKACRNIDDEGWRGREVPIAKAVIENKRPVHRINMQTDPDTLDPGFFRRQGLVSFLGVPMLVKGKILGILSFYTREEHQFGDEEINFLTTLSNQAAIAIHNSQLYEEIESKRDEISALQTVTATASESLELDAVLQKVIKEITKIFHFDAMRVNLFDFQTHKVKLKAHYDTTSNFLVRSTHFPWDQGITAKVTETGEPVIFENALGDPRYKELSHTKEAQNCGYKFLAVFPIKSKSKTLGTIVCIGQDPRRLTPEEIQLITSMGDQIGVAVENAQLFEEVKKKSNELEALVKINRDVVALLDRETLLGNISEQAKKLLNMDGANFRLIEGEHLNLVSASWPEDVHLRQTTMLDEGVAGKVVRENRVVAIKNILEDPIIIEEHREILAKAGLHGFIGVPLQVKGSVIGVLQLLSREEREFLQSEIDLLIAFADQAAIAIENAQLFEETRDRANELLALYTVATAVTQSLDTRFVLHTVMEIILKTFYFDAASIYLFDDDQKKLCLLAHQGFPKEIALSTTFIVGEGTTGRAFESGELVFYEDIQTDPEYHKLARRKVLLEAGYRGHFCMPIGVKGKTLGVINFVSKNAHRFLPNEVKLMQSLTNQIGVALENARFYEQTKKQAVALEKELEEHRRTELALQESEARTNAIVNTAADGIITIDEQGIIESFNAAAERVFGYAADEVIGQNASMLMVFPYREEDNRKLAHYFNTGEVKIIGNSREIAGQRKDGTTFSIELNVSEVHLGTRRVFTGIVRDITDRNRAKEALLQSEKLAAAGQLAARIAHEINNPLAGIKNSFLLVKGGISQTYPYYRYVGRIEKEIDRISRIVRQMFDLYRPGQESLQEFRVGEILRDIVALMQLSCREYGVTIKLDNSDGAGVVCMSENSLRQVLYNVIVNAVEISPRGEVVRVRARALGDVLTITVHDKGKGIPANLHSKIFEAFFTTKNGQTKRGLGLGLSVSHSLVQAMGGKLDFDSKPGRGTVFTVTLPSHGGRTEVQHG